MVSATRRAVATASPRTSRLHRDAERAPTCERAANPILTAAADARHDQCRPGIGHFADRDLDQTRAAPLQRGIQLSPQLARTGRPAASDAEAFGHLREVRVH